MNKKIWYVCLVKGNRLFVQHCATKKTAETILSQCKKSFHPVIYGLHGWIDFVWRQDYNKNGFSACHGSDAMQCDNLLSYFDITD